VIILNKEFKLGAFKNPKAILLPGGGILLLLAIALGGWLILQKLNSSSLASSRSRAAEGSDSAQIGSHNECAETSCKALEGIGPNDCTSNLDCQKAECENVVVEPANPKIGDTNIKFICQGTTLGGNSAGSVYFKIEAPSGGSGEEYLCPSSSCQLEPNGNSFKAVLEYPQTLIKGTYKVMTKTCFKLFSGKEICGEYKTPTP